MELLVPRDELGDYERALIDALFNPGQTKTDTTAIRKRYAVQGLHAVDEDREAAPAAGESARAR